MAAALARMTVLIAALGMSAPAAAQPGDVYAGKTLRVIVGLEAGGTVDTLARAFSVHLRKHIPGNPAIIIQNMPGAGGWGATNYLYERATPDGLTILYGPWDPLGQALGDQGLRARYENFEYLGNTDISGLLPHLALDVLGVKHKMIVGYRGGNDVFLAMQRGEVGFHSTSISTFRSRNLGFIRSGQGIGVAYLVPVDSNGDYEKSQYVTEMPAYPDLYKEVHGKLPSGVAWDALNWLTNQTGEMTYVGLAPRGTPAAAVAALRKGFAGASNDPAFVKETMTRNGVPFSYIGTERGQAIFRSLADVSPDVLATLRVSIGANR